MSSIDELSKTFILLIHGGIVFRVGHAFFTMLFYPDEAEVMKKRIQHAIIFLILANGVFALKTIIVSYYH